MESKENQNLYGTGTGFAFVPHHQTVSDRTVARTSDSSNNKAGNGNEKEQQSKALSSKAELNTLPGEEASEEAEVNRFYHATITPGAENPALGQYVCFISHPSA